MVDFEIELMIFLKDGIPINLGSFKLTNNAVGDVNRPSNLESGNAN